MENKLNHLIRRVTLLWWMCPERYRHQNSSSKRQDSCLSGCDGCSETGDCEKKEMYFGVARWLALWR